MDNIFVVGPHLVPIRSPLGPTCSSLGPHLAPTWSHLVRFASTWSHFPLDLMWSPLGPNWSPSGSHLVAAWSPKESQRTRGPLQGSQKKSLSIGTPKGTPEDTKGPAMDPGTAQGFKRSPTGSLDLFFDMGLRTVAPTSFGGTLLESGAECHTESILCPCIVPIMYQGCRLSSTVRVLCWDNNFQTLS